MSNRTAVLLLCTLLLVVVAACGGADPVPDPIPEAPAIKVQAQPLAGPFASPEAFCESLGAPACEQRDDIIFALSRATSFTTRSGQTIEIVTMASRDEQAQAGHLLLKRADGYWALRDVIRYEPSETRRQVGELRAARVDADGALPDGVEIHLGFTTEEGSGDGKAWEFTTWEQICSLTPGKPVACYRFTTERGIGHGEAAETRPSEFAQILLIIKGNRAEASALGEESPYRKEVVEPGVYEIEFP